MEKITFDAGLRRYRINGGGVLQFNPADPNLYARFLEAVERIKEMEEDLQKAEGGALEAMCRADRTVKQLLGQVFGEGNDFDALLGGVNLLAVAGNGERVITHLLQALLPVLTEGAKLCAAGQAEQAVKKAQKRRVAQ